MMEIQRVLFDVMVDCINQSDDMMCLFVCVGGRGGRGCMQETGSMRYIHSFIL